MTQMLAIRPEPGLSATVAAGRASGLEISGTALFEILPIKWEMPDKDAVDALLVGSANAIRHGGENLAQFLEKPAYVVGKTTEKVASAAGFSIASVGEGGLQNVIDAIAHPTRLLRIAGADHVALTPPHGVSIETVIAYESVPLPLNPQIIASGRVVVLLHSAAAARHFASECDRLSISRADIELAALGPRIAEAAGKNWRAIHVCDRPNDADLLAMVHALCQ